MNRMVNEQAEVSLLLAAPGIVATLSLAPLVIAAFYSGSFGDAVAVLRWQVLGILLRVASWPFGFAILAKGHGKLYFWTELLANAVHLGAIWLGVAIWGLVGTGIAFVALYSFYWTMMYWVVRGAIGFRYAVATCRVLYATTPVVAAAFLGSLLLPTRWAVLITLPLALMLGWHCGNRLAALVPESRPARAWNRLRRLCGIAG
jgi:antigen flippase